MPIAVVPPVAVARTWRSRLSEAETLASPTLVSEPLAMNATLSRTKDDDVRILMPIEYGLGPPRLRTVRSRTSVDTTLANRVALFPLNDSSLSVPEQEHEIVVAPTPDPSTMTPDFNVTGAVSTYVPGAILTSVPLELAAIASLNLVKSPPEGATHTTLSGVVASTPGSPWGPAGPVGPAGPAGPGVPLPLVSVV